MDIFEKLLKNFGPLGKYADDADGYYMFPRLEGPISNRMMFNGKERLVWSLNNYLGLANHPEVRKVDAEAAAQYGLAYPMGARMLSGQTEEHMKLEQGLADFVGQEAAYLYNFGYQGIVSTIDALVDRHDVIVFDAEIHASLMDGKRLHLGQSFKFRHNDMEDAERMIKKAQEVVAKTGGGILVITEGVYGMTGEAGNVGGLAELKKKYDFRLMVDDAHGVGVMGPNGRGIGEHFGCEEAIDLHIGTFAKSFALIGGFVAGKKEIIRYLRFNMRSQIYAKSLPMPLVIGAQKRLQMMKDHPELREQLWTIVNAIQGGFRDSGFNIGKTNTCVTPVFLNGSVAEATQLTYDVREVYNLFCSIVTYPVIPKGMIILRIIPTAVHTLEDVEYTLKVFNAVKAKLDSGEYAKMGIKSMNA